MRSKLNAETPLDAANRHVAETEARRIQQLSLIAERMAEDEAQAQRIPAEIERTLAIACAHRSLIQSLEDDR